MTSPKMHNWYPRCERTRLAFGAVVKFDSDRLEAHHRIQDVERRTLFTLCYMLNQLGRHSP
jgi:hypothetical protein